MCKVNVVKMNISPSELYPMTTIESIDPERLKSVIENIKQGVVIPPIKVVKLDEYYIIINGSYEMIAANALKFDNVEIEILDSNKDYWWSKKEDLEAQLKSVGMTALYDFEALGGFTYKEYPTFYRRR